MPGQARILLVADEPFESEHLRRLISQVAPDRGLVVAKSDKEGLDALEDNDFEVVFAGFAAGASETVRFLNEVWKRRARTVRFLFADALPPEVMVSCALGAHHFIPKPVNEETIAGALARADAMSRFVRNDRIQALVSKMRTLPSRPSLYIEVMRELRAPNASANTVGELVSKDLAISTKLIQVVNSAFYGLQQQVTDPAAAVLLLGLDTTASLILSIEAFARFDKVKPIYFSMDKVWKHSQSVAQSAMKIAELMNNETEVARNAYTAGLLHDIGKLALALNFEEQYHGALKLAEAQGISACEVEKQVFGATHAEAGAYLLSLWGLPLPIVEAVADHHLAAEAVSPKFSAAVALHLAERLEGEADLRRSGIKDVKLDLAYPPELNVVQRLNEFRSVVRGEAVSEERKGSSAKSAPKSAPRPKEELKSVAAALPASGASAPLVNVGDSSSRKPAPKLMIGIGVGAVALLILGGVMMGKKKEPSVNPAGAGKVETRPPVVEPVVTAVPEPVAAKLPVEDAAEKLSLQAIMFRGAKSSLVINGKSFRLGDEVEGARIVAIEQKGITIEKDGVQRPVGLMAR